MNQMYVKLTKGVKVLILLLVICNFSYGQEDLSFLNPPMLIKNPSSNVNYTPESRKFTGIPSLAVSPEGRIWAVWYAGITPGEDLNNYVVVATSGDNGETWEEILVIDPDGPGPVRAFDPEVWIDPNGQLWVIWAQNISPPRSTRSGVWAITTDTPGAANPEWSDPQRLVDGVMMCKPVVLSNNEWALPTAFWHNSKDHSKIAISDDNGKNWTIRGSVNIPKKEYSPPEHMIIELKDGSLRMLVRTQYGIGESISNDKGYTWSTLVPSEIKHCTSRFFITRLNSGNLLLVKHGPIDMRIVGRSHLMAFISEDDGVSWSNGLLLDERLGVSYPDGQQTSDGTIYITYDYDRRNKQHILMTSFTEDDILSPKQDGSIIKIYNNRKLISEGGK